MVANAARSAASFLKRFQNIHARAFKRRRQAKDESSAKRDSQGKQQNAGIESDVAGAGQRTRQEIQDGFGSYKGDKQTQNSAESGEHRALSQELTNDSSLAGSE